MGYFSELNYMQHEEMEWSDPTTLQQLADRIDYLNDRLGDIEMHPAAVYFYQNYLPLPNKTDHLDTKSI